MNFSATRAIARGDYARVQIEDYTPHSLLGREAASGAPKNWLVADKD